MTLNRNKGLEIPHLPPSHHNTDEGSEKLDETSAVSTVNPVDVDTYNNMADLIWIYEKIFLINVPYPIM